MLMTTIPTPIGEFHAYADDRGLYRLLFPDCFGPDTSEDIKKIPHGEHPVFSRVTEQLNEYLKGNRRAFDLSLSAHGTNFQQLVWNLLCKIPYGKTSTYGQLAKELGNRNKARAVGGAAHVNPLPIIIPCHRLIGARGSLTGFAGGLSIKKYLLKLEGALDSGGKTNENQLSNR